MSKFTSAALSLTALAFIGAPLAAQTVTPTSPNGWVYFDGNGAGDSPSITNAQPYNGNGSLQFTITNGNQQPSAAYIFNNAISLASVTSLSLGYTVLDPNNPPATTPTIRFLLSGIANGGQTGRSDGSFGSYDNTAYTTFTTDLFSMNTSNFFLRIGGVGQASADCQNANTNGNFDGDRRNSIQTYVTNCTGGTAVDLRGATIIGVEVDAGRFTPPAAGYNAFVDQILFSVSTVNGVQQSGNFNFELAAGGNVVPEPATVSLLGMGLVGLAGAARRRKRTA